MLTIKLDPNDTDFNLFFTEHNKSNFNDIRKVNSSVINRNELSEYRNTNTRRTPQKPLTIRNLPNDLLKKVVILRDNIVKQVKGWEISQKGKTCRVKVMYFSGAEYCT